VGEPKFGAKMGVKSNSRTQGLAFRFLATYLASGAAMFGAESRGFRNPGKSALSASLGDAERH